MVVLGTNTRALGTPVLLLAALATTVAACGGNDGDAGSTTESDTTTAAADQKWKRVVPRAAGRIAHVFRARTRARR
jgi:hypothetical protein